MSQFWSDLVHKLKPYIPGEQPKIDQLVKLNTNENPYGPPPQVLSAIRESANEDLRLYPDPNADALKQALATYHNLNIDQVFVGNGSDEVLAHAFLGLLKRDDPLLLPDITYSFYSVYCDLYGIEYCQIPLNADFELDPTDYEGRRCGGVVFANPNAPTGHLLSLEAIERILHAHPNVVVLVDEAYVDFGGRSAVQLLPSYRNLLITRTFSKSRALAGLRVGYALGGAELVQGLERVKNCFNSYPLGRPAQAGAITSLGEESWLRGTCRKIIDNRERLTHALSLLGFVVLPSSANFLFAHHPKHAGSALAAALREHHIVVRHFDMPRISDFLRITVGSDQECDALISALKTII